MTYGVAKVLEKRVGAKLAEAYLVDTTPPEVREEARERRERARTHRGMGRPSRKEREALKKLFADGE